MNRDAIDFENGRVSTLFRRILIPTLMGSLAISAVTAIDGIFIGHGVGADGVAAVNIVVPIYQIMSGIGLMVGAGCSVVSSIHVGQGKPKVARLNITQALVATTLLSAIICATILLFPTDTARLLGSSDTLLPQVKDYLLW
ncbi:MAG: MATE family efflux transporter, partial [Bacteroidaceae bacterium]|nr:MATE family efflux transporter [Bacteroidaceae bacterium]